MSEGTRIPLAQAEAYAAELIEDFTPYCERIEVVGSIRRRRPTIGDIEILAVPLVTRETDLFGDFTGEAEDLLDRHCWKLVKRGELEHRLDKNGRPAFGLKYKRLLFRGVGLDLFVCSAPAQRGVLSIIRTGSADFAHRLVTICERHAFNQAGRDIGRGWMPVGMVCRDGALWIVASGQTIGPIETPTEEAVFDAIQKPYVPPEQREVSP